MPRALREDEVVVTGMGVVTALGVGVDAFTRALRQGNSAPLSKGSMLIRDFDLIAFFNSLHLTGNISPAVRQAARRAPLSLQL